MGVEHLDVLVIGAGISGIGAGYHLQTYCPGRTFAILEGRADLGGTWDLFRYPGVRSDSDMHTLGYSFKPWTAEKAIADGPSILAYLRETVAEHGLDRHLRFHHLVRRADWSSGDATWTVEVDRRDTGTTERIRCDYLFMCSGYYSYRHGHTPEFAGRERFAGPVLHPQEWPEDFDPAGRRIAVIGSGATAVTLVPALAERGAAHVTMIQRSPTYVVSRPDVDAVNRVLRKVLPERLAYDLTRRKNIALQRFIYRRSRTKPEKMKAQLLGLVGKELGPDYDVATHFTPRYNPWDQRLCLVPNGDLFASIRSGVVSVVTGTISTWTEQGVEMASGEVVEADVIVTATGLDLVTLGEVSFSLDGEPIDFSKTFTYKGLAYSDVPNLASSFGYINASWTLRADLTCRYVCRLLNHLDATGTVQCTPRLRESDRDMTAGPFVDDFSAGYLQRVLDRLPKQGDRDPWRHPQDYANDKVLLLEQPVDDGVMRFTSPTRATASDPAPTLSAAAD